MKCISSIITRRNPRRISACLCVLLLVLSCCVPAGAVPASLTVAMVVSPQMQIRPLQVMERDAVTLFDLVYESLIELDDSGMPQPSLAESWEVLSDGKTWLFKIRQGIRFHNGPEMTAYDVVATMDAIRRIAQDESLGDGDRGLYRTLVDYCASWTADDSYTLRVRTDDPSYSVLYAMTFPVLQAQTIGDPIPPGTGPYRISYYNPGSMLLLEANQNWWGQTPAVREITGVWYEDSEHALAAYEAEQVDIMMTRSVSAVRYRGTVTSRTNSYDYCTQQLECLLFNTYASRLSDVRMRQAIAYAINRSRLMTSVYQGVATMANTIVHPSSWLYYEDGDVMVYAHNQERANALLDELGWQLRDADGYRYKRTDDENVYLSFRIYYYNESGNTLRKEAALEIQSMLQAVGIRTAVTYYTFDGARAKLKSGDFDLCVCAFNFDTVPDPSFLLASGGSANYAVYRSSAVKDLLKQLKKSYTESEYQDIWKLIQAKVSQDLPLFPLYWRDGVMLSREAFSAMRTIRESSLLKSIESYR